MLAERFKGVLGAGRSESACRRLERRDADLVELYQDDEREDQDLLQYFKGFIHRQVFLFRHSGRMMIIFWTLPSVCQPLKNGCLQKAELPSDNIL